MQNHRSWDICSTWISFQVQHKWLVLIILWFLMVLKWIIRKLINIRKKYKNSTKQIRTIYPEKVRKKYETITKTHPAKVGKKVRTKCEKARTRKPEQIWKYCRRRIADTTCNGGVRPPAAPKNKEAGVLLPGIFYPNAWRQTRHSGLLMVFGRISSGSIRSIQQPKSLRAFQYHAKERIHIFSAWALGVVFVLQLGSLTPWSAQSVSGLKDWSLGQKVAGRKAWFVNPFKGPDCQRAQGLEPRSKSCRTKGLVR